MSALRVQDMNTVAPACDEVAEKLALVASEMESTLIDNTHSQPNAADEVQDSHVAADLVSNKKHQEVDASVASNAKSTTAAATTVLAPAPAGSFPVEMTEERPEISNMRKFLALMSFVVVLLFAHLRETYRRFVPSKNAAQGRKPGYAPLVKDFDFFWQRRFYRRLRDCWNRPIDSRPSRVIGVMERVSNDYNATFEFTGRTVPCVNLGSYNYLGFAEDTPSITHDVLDSLDRFGIASCSAPLEAGQSKPLRNLERGFADFLSKDDAIVCGMGFATNFMSMPALFDRETLVISDSLNHNSLVNGVRASGAKVRVFPHDNFAKLESLLREGVVLGQSATGEFRPWRRIVIVVEGIYSMEGEIIDLRRVVELKKKYHALLFVDEAHSIGAIGRTGRGVMEHCGVDPRDVDVLMGTFTKSFGSIGGYIASSQSVIDYMRSCSSISLVCDTLAPPCAQQALSVLNVLQGNDGTDLGAKRIHQLAENSRFFRQGLIDRGFVVLGNDASPVVPVMLYNLGKLAAVSRACLERGIAVVMVGYPASALLECRVRFCVSAAHTIEDLQYTLDVMCEINEFVHMTYNPPRKAIKCETKNTNDEE